MGEPGSPTPLSEGCARPHPPAGGGMGKPGFPIPLRGGGVGKPGFPTPLRESQALLRAGRWGNPVPPPPSPRAVPSHTLPRVGAWGNPVSPFPCGAGAWGNPVSPFPCVSARPSCGRGDGGTRFPHPPLRGLRPPTPSRGRGDGETGFPHSPAGRGRGETRFPHTLLQQPMFTLD